MIKPRKHMRAQEGTRGHKREEEEEEEEEEAVM
jgi:hypothetical protein